MTITAGKIKPLIKNKGDKVNEENKTPGIEEVEELLVLVQHQAKPHGATKMKRFFPSDKYKQNGIDKLEVLGSKKCTRDLKAKVPENSKRKAPKNPTTVTDPIAALTEQVTRLVEAVEILVSAKR